MVTIAFLPTAEKYVSFCPPIRSPCCAFSAQLTKDKIKSVFGMMVRPNGLGMNPLRSSRSSDCWSIIPHAADEWGHPISDCYFLSLTFAGETSSRFGVGHTVKLPRTAMWEVTQMLKTPRIVNPGCCSSNEDSKSSLTENFVHFQRSD